MKKRIVSAILLFCLLLPCLAACDGIGIADNLFVSDHTREPQPIENDTSTAPENGGTASPDVPKQTNAPEAGSSDAPKQTNAPETGKNDTPVRDPLAVVRPDVDLNSISDPLLRALTATQMQTNIRINYTNSIESTVSVSTVAGPYNQTVTTQDSGYTIVVDNSQISHSAQTQQSSDGSSQYMENTLTLIHTGDGYRVFQKNISNYGFGLSESNAYGTLSYQYLATVTSNATALDLVLAAGYSSGITEIYESDTYESIETAVQGDVTVYTCRRPSIASLVGTMGMTIDPDKSVCIFRVKDGKIISTDCTLVMSMFVSVPDEGVSTSSVSTTTMHSEYIYGGNRVSEPADWDYSTADEMTESQTATVLGLVPLT